jgi:hypothetical protein
MHVPDVQSDPEYAYAVRDEQPIRTTLAVPMLKEHDLIGTIIFTARSATSRRKTLQSVAAAPSMIPAGTYKAAIFRRAHLQIYE